MSRLAEIALGLIGQEKTPGPSRKSSPTAAGPTLKEGFVFTPARQPGLPRIPAETKQAGIVVDEEISAALIKSASLGESVWLVADRAALEDNPDIERAGLPVVFFDEVRLLLGRPIDELRQLLQVKRVFPTARILQ